MHVVTLSSSSASIPTAPQPSCVTVPLAQGVDLNAQARVGQMIQMAMRQKVAPALGVVYLSLATSQAATNDRVATLEQEVRTLRIRAA